MSREQAKLELTEFLMKAAACGTQGHQFSPGGDWCECGFNKSAWPGPCPSWRKKKEILERNAKHGWPLKLTDKEEGDDREDSKDRRQGGVLDAGRGDGP